MLKRYTFQATQVDIPWQQISLFTILVIVSWSDRKDNFQPIECYCWENFHIYFSRKSWCISQNGHCYREIWKNVTWEIISQCISLHKLCSGNKLRLKQTTHFYFLPPSQYIFPETTPSIVSRTKWWKKAAAYNKINTVYKDNTENEQTLKQRTSNHCNRKFSCRNVT